MLPGKAFETDAEHGNMFPTDQGQERLETAVGAAAYYGPLFVLTLILKRFFRKK
jgi:hypothetical protein